jgi:tetratricopeptide (TPR) repeat protein
MEHKFRMRFNWAIGLALTTMTIFSCNSYDRVSEERARLERAKAVYLIDTTVRDAMMVNYEVGNTSLEMRLYFKQTEFEVEFDNTGKTDSAKLDVGEGAEVTKSPIPGKTELKPGETSYPPTDKELKKDMVAVLKYYQEAQRLFYADDFKGSLAEIDKSLAIMPTADAFAFKGSILFTLGEVEQAKVYWVKAKNLDPNFVIPTVKLR